MFCANTINVGADLGAVAAAGGSLLTGSHVQPAWLVVPMALLIGFLQLRLAYSIIFEVFKLLTLALFAYVITVIVVHPQLLETLEATFIPHFELNKGFIGIVVAILGTTISPYLFFWQASSEVEEMKAAGARTEKERRGTTRKELQRGAHRRVRRDAVLPAGDVLHHPDVRHGAARVGSHQHRQTRAAGRASASPARRTLRVRALLGRHDRHRTARHSGADRQRGVCSQGVLRLPRQPQREAASAVRRSMRSSWSRIIGGLRMNFLNIDPIQALVVTAIINGVVAPPILVLIALLARDRSCHGGPSQRLLEQCIGMDRHSGDGHRGGPPGCHPLLRVLGASPEWRLAPRVCRWEQFTSAPSAR